MGASKILTNKTLQYMGVKYQREKNLQDNKLSALINMRETLKRKLDTFTSINQDNRWFGMNSDMTALINFSDAHLMDIASYLMAAENGFEAINNNLVVAIDRLDELIDAAQPDDVRDVVI